jgi:integrase/recombinase XerD
MPRWPDRVPAGDPGDPRGFEVLLGRFLEWMAVHHYSETTVKGNRFMLRRFASWCADRDLGQPGEVSRSTLERYQRWLFHYRRKNGKPLAHRTQTRQLTGVKNFFRWLTKERYLLYDPASSLELPKAPPRIPTETLSIEEVEQILATPNAQSPMGLRDRAILEVFYSTGLRRAELAALNVYDIDRDRAWLTVRHGKGDRARVVPLGERALAWVERYLEEVRPELVIRADEWALFLTVEGGCFTADSLGNRVRKILDASGVRERWGACHLFRHTMATQMLEGGADIRYIQEMLGHAQLNTTEIYTRVSIHKLQEVHTATHPAAKLERKRDSAEDPGTGEP